MNEWMNFSELIYNTYKNYNTGMQNHMRTMNSLPHIYWSIYRSIVLQWKQMDQTRNTWRHKLFRENVEELKIMPGKSRKHKENSCMRDNYGFHNQQLWASVGSKCLCWARGSLETGAPGKPYLRSQKTRNGFQYLAIIQHTV